MNDNYKKMTGAPIRASTEQGAKAFLREFLRQKSLILMSIPGLILVFIFNYIPIYGIIIAFQEYNPVKGFFGSEWVGLKYFRMFFSNHYTFRLLTNTLLLGVYSLLWSFPAPIILALMMDLLRSQRYKKVVQTISYFPHFISTVVVAGLIRELCGVNGVFNMIRNHFGLDSVAFLTSPEWYRTMFIGSGVWQGVGWGSIIFLSALSNVDPQLHEAAVIDGANRWQRVKHIMLPSIAPTITVLLIFSISGILGSDFQKGLLLYNEATYSVSDVIGTYTYREGIQGGMYEYTAAIGLLMSVVSCVLIVVTNWVSRRVSENSLW